MRRRRPLDNIPTVVLRESATGDCATHGARQRRHEGGYCLLAVLYIDAMSVFAACAASHIKTQLTMRRCSSAIHQRDAILQTVDGIVWGGYHEHDSCWSDRTHSGQGATAPMHECHHSDQSRRKTRVCHVECKLEHVARRKLALCDQSSSTPRLQCICQHLSVCAKVV